MITRACRQQSQSEGINHVKQTPTNPNAKPSPEKSHHNPIKKKTTCNSNGRCSNNKPKETARLQANDEQDAKGTSSDCQWATSTRNQEQKKNRWTDQLATPHRVDESIDPNYFRYFSKYFGSNQPTRSNAVHSLLALLTSILQACWASVLRNSLPMASARTRASKMRRLLHR